MAKTVQDIFDEMSDVQKDAAALLFGAIAENDEAVGGDTVVSGDQTLEEVFNSLSSLQLNTIAFIAGGIEPEAQHSDISADEEFLGEFLEHFGVKGMRWGVRKDRPTSTTGAKIPLSKSAKNNEASRREARLKVKQNKATLEEAHVAGLKSTGHRVANGFLGDKTFWKKTGVAAALTAAGAYGSLFVPGLLPDKFIEELGTFAAVGTMGSGIALVPKADLERSVVAAGELAVTAASAAAVGTVGAVAVGANAVGNVARAVRGNARVSKSYEKAKVGRLLEEHQSAGTAKTHTILKRNGSLKVRHDDEFMGDFLEHFGIKGMRWGIRRKVTSDGTVDKSDAGSPSGKSMSDETAELQKSADFDRAAKAYAKASEKGVQALSNEEIKAITNRVQAEKSFRALSESQASELQTRVNQLRLEKEYRQLQGELAQKKASTGKKVIAGLLSAAVSAAQKEASDLGKSLVQDMVGKKKTPTLKDQLKSKNELLRLRKENAELYRDLGSLGAMPSASGTPFRVNPAKVKISRP